MNRDSAPMPRFKETFILHFFLFRAGRALSFLLSSSSHLRLSPITSKATHSITKMQSAAVALINVSGFHCRAPTVSPSDNFPRATTLRSA